MAAASAIGTESSDRQITLAQQPDFIRDGLASDLQPSQPVWDGTAEISLPPMRQTDPYLEQVEVGPQEQREAWSVDLASQAPAWMTYDDVDLNSLNASIMASTGWFDCPHSLVTDPTISIGAPQRPSETISVTERPEERIRRQWFTSLSTPSPAHITPDGKQEQSHVDEGYRNNLVERLQQRVPTEPLPSTDFLVSSGFLAASCTELDHFTDLLELVYPNVFYSVQSRVSNHSWSDFSTIQATISASVVHLFGRKFISLLESCRITGYADIRDS